MATILQYYQTLQLVKYLYTIIHSSHRYYKQPLLFPRDPKAHNTQQPILIELYTDTSFTDSVKPHSIIVILNKKRSRKLLIKFDKGQDDSDIPDIDNNDNLPHVDKNDNFKVRQINNDVSNDASTLSSTQLDTTSGRNVFRNISIDSFDPNFKSTEYTPTESIELNEPVLQTADKYKFKSNLTFSDFIRDWFIGCHDSQQIPIYYIKNQCKGWIKYCGDSQYRKYRRVAEVLCVLFGEKKLAWHRDKIDAIVEEIVCISETRDIFLNVGRLASFLAGTDSCSTKLSGK
ncbi:hypothetical protein C6P40_004598 [Pichia californica]|uniref:Uncharacterized protein n=1 Tax=Pichia californica TaxID=460514 RepID=A0A9P6WMJ3_9ASCO|nr:hypothetical protein C6P40_004598 [[Candida] californica]